jgi:thioesterase domain-containing protein
MTSIDDDGAPLAAPKSPAGELEAKVARIWQQIRPELDSVTEQTYLLDGGCRGRHLTALVDAIALEFESEVLPAELIASPTVRETASLARRGTRAGQTPLLVRLTAGEEGTPLVLMAGSQGSFVYFFEITRLLPAERPCYGFEAPGIRPGERPPRSIRSLARRYAQEVQREFGRRPVVLVGLCLAGTIAHELARQLALRGTPPHLLVLGDTPCPTRVRARRPWSSRKRRIRVALPEMRGWLKVARNKTAGLDARIVQLRWTRTRAHLGHRPRQIETDTVLVTSDEFRRYYGCRDLGWGPFVRGDPQLVELGGGHFEILRFKAPATMSAIEEVLAERGL